MCFNETTSLITFSISLFCFTYLLYIGLKKNNKNDIFLSFLVIVIGLMQLIELFLWKNQRCDKINHILSLLVIVLLFFQCLVTNILYIILYPGKKAVFSDTFVFMYLLLYFIFVIYILYYLNKQTLCSQPTKHSCRLVWDAFVKLNNNFILYVIFAFFYFFTYVILGSNSLSSNNLLTKYPLRYTFLIITLIIAMIYIFMKSNVQNIKNKSLSNFINSFFTITASDAFGSTWCFLAVFIGIIGILKI